MKGAKAPFDGTIVDDTALRMIDLELARGTVCERSFRDAPCIVTSQESAENFFFFLAGAVIGGVVTSLVAK